MSNSKGCCRSAGLEGSQNQMGLKPRSVNRFRGRGFRTSCLGLAVYQHPLSEPPKLSKRVVQRGLSEVLGLITSKDIAGLLGAMPFS